MRMLIKNTKGHTLIELVTIISVLGVVSLAVGSTLVYLLSSFDLSSGRNSVELVAQRVLTKITDEVRQARAQPDNFRIWVSDDKMSLRFYLSESLADSIKYIARQNGTELFLYRSFRNQPEVLVPDFSTQMVDFVKTTFSVDDSTVGFSQEGRVNINLAVGRKRGTESCEANLECDIFSRNY